jgi:GntR family transcriptional regulator
LFRFFRFQTLDGERQIPQSRILAIAPVTAPAEVARALGVATGEAVIHLQRLRLLEEQPVLAEDIWLPLARFKALLTVDLADHGPLLYPIYEELCGQIIASADETLTAELADSHHGQLLGIASGSPVVVVERLARNHAGQPLEWRRSRGHASHFRYSVEIR